MITGKELLDEYENGMTYPEIEEKYGLTHGQVAGRIYAERIRQKLNLKTPSRPELFQVDIGKPLHFTGDTMAVGDVHVPTTDYALWTMVLMVAKKQLKAPRRLILAGDLFNMDVFSKYPSFQPKPTWRDELQAARQMLDEAAEVFAEIAIIMGNHDERATKMTKADKLSEDLLSSVTLGMKKPPIISTYGFCTIESSTETWRITHPEDYRKNQLSVADDLALKYDMNIVSFHEHHFGIGYDKYKRHIIVNGGGLFDKTKMEYANRTDNTKAGMQQGFVMLRGGYPYLFGDGNFTDYSMWVEGGSNRA